MNIDKFPRWEVFIRSKRNIRHKYASSLHAVDEEEALFNARDVYTRRMEGVSLWIAPTTAVAEFVGGKWIRNIDGFEDKEQPFEVFTRRKAGIEHLHALSVMAENPKQALEKVQATLIKDKKAESIWVIPTEKIIVSDPNEATFYFEPAKDKLYRHASHYDLPDGIEHM